MNDRQHAETLFHEIVHYLFDDEGAEDGHLEDERLHGLIECFAVQAASLLAMIRPYAPSERECNA